MSDKHIDATSGRMRLRFMDGVRQWDPMNENTIVNKRENETVLDFICRVLRKRRSKRN
jgi:hypothetical protein